MTEALIDGFIATKMFQDILGGPLSNYVEVMSNPVSSEEERAKAEKELTDAVGKAEEATIGLAETLRKNRESKPWKPEDYDVAGDLGSSLMSVDFVVGDTKSLEAFKESFGNSLRDYIKKQLIDAFLQSAAIKPLLDRLGAFLGEALADGVIDAGEQRVVDGYVDQITRATLPFQKALSGLDSSARVDVVERGSLNEMLDEYDTVNSDAYLDTKREEIEAQKKLNGQKIIALMLEQALLQTQLANMRLQGVPEQIINNSGVNEALEANGKLIENYRAQNEALDEQAKNLDQLRGKEREKLVIAIKAELGIDQPTLRDNLKSAFSADTYAEFLDGFATSLKETLANAILEVMLSKGPMAKAIEQFSNEAFNYLRDGVITPEERDKLMDLGRNMAKLGEDYYKMMEEAGLLIPDFSKLDLGELYQDRSQGALDEISSRLGTTADDFAGSLRSAFDAENLDEFKKKLKEGVKQSIRDAMIAAFLESAAIKPLLDALSQGVLDAMADGELTQDEKDYLLGLQATLGIESEAFFGVLDELGLGFSDLGYPVSNVFPGTVMYADWPGSWSDVVVLQADEWVRRYVSDCLEWPIGSLEVQYAHLLHMPVPVGEVVSAGACMRKSLHFTITSRSLCSLHPSVDSRGNGIGHGTLVGWT